MAKRTRDRLAERYGVNVLHLKRPRQGGRSRSKWLAYTGGGGSGVPVVEVAEAFTLDALKRKLERIAAKTAAV